MATKLNALGSISVRATWESLRGRKLVQFGGRIVYTESHKARLDFAHSGLIQTSPDEIATALPDLIQRITDPLYESFGFYNMPREWIEGIAAELPRRSP